MLQQLLQQEVARAAFGIGGLTGGLSASIHSRVSWVRVVGGRAEQFVGHC
jgi:hypothetical protein